MDAKTNGQQPAGVVQETATMHGSGGLTKRELFAAMAMQGYISRGHTNDPYFFAGEAIKCAELLLEELSKATTDER